MKLDRSKPFGTVFGSSDGAAFEQGGVLFDAEGNAMQPVAEQPRRPGRPPKAQPDADPEAMRKASLAALNEDPTGE